MAKRLTNNIITGNDPRLGMCFYYSPYFDQNIWRRASSLTGKRTRKDPAFKGFRQSSNRLKEASPIAASLYKLVPEPVKRYALYRTLTGEAIKMLKEGIEVAVITETLKKNYIDILLNCTEKKPGTRMVQESVTRDRRKGMTDFTSFPQMASGIRKPAGTRRSLLLQNITTHQAADGYFSTADSDPLSPNRSVSESSSGLQEPPRKPGLRTKTTNGLIYLGRLAECKMLKLWLRPAGSSAPGSLV